MRTGMVFGCALSMTLLSLGSASALADKKRRVCGAPQPILSTSDFNGDGIVDKKDLVLIKSVVKQKLYYAFYDRNADGKVNGDDKDITKKDQGLNSTKPDQEIAKLFHQVKQFQLVRSDVEMNAMGQTKRTGSLKGHGEPWANTFGIDAIAGRGPSLFYRPEGLNFPMNGKAPWGLFWGKAAKPVFENGATDYPLPGGAWMNSRVIAFADHPPRFTSSPSEKWHTHAGLCFTTETVDGKKRIVLNQHTTFVECQAIPSEDKLANSPIGPINPWVNIWMLHVWMFNLNPHGLFAGTHPCLDADAPPEHTINGGRPVPPFFKHEHGG